MENKISLLQHKNIMEMLTTETIKMMKKTDLDITERASYIVLRGDKKTFDGHQKLLSHFAKHLDENLKDEKDIELLNILKNNGFFQIKIYRGIKKYRFDYSTYKKNTFSFDMYEHFNISDIIRKNYKFV